MGPLGGHWGLDEVMRVEISLQGQCPYNREHQTACCLPLCHGRHSKKAAVYKLGRELSPESDPAGTLILDFQPLET